MSVPVAEVVKAIATTISAINTLMSVLNASQEFKEAVAKAIAEGRDITHDELDNARDEAREAIDKALED